MTKSDLRTGMVVKNAKNRVGIVLKDTAAVDGIKWFLNGNKDVMINYWEELDSYKEDLTNYSLNGSNIVAIYQTCNFNDYTTIKVYDEENLIWEREYEPVDITIKEIEEKLGYKIKIVG